MDAVHLGDDLTHVVVSRDDLERRIQEIALEIDSDYANLDKPLLMIGVLKGAVMVMADLARAISIPLPRSLSWATPCS